MRAAALACASLVAAWTFYSVSWLSAPPARDPCVVLEETRSHGASLVPKIVHQQWKTSDDVPERFRKWRAEFLRLFPEPQYAHYLWTDVTMRELIAGRFPWFLNTYDAYPKPIQRADAFRYFVMYEYGGLYADMDYRPLVNFWNWLPADRPAFIESPHRFTENVQNSLMSSPAKHPFWNETFEVLAARAGGYLHGSDVLYTTGPKMLDEAARRYKGETAVLPCEIFHRIPLGEAGAEANAPTTFVRAITAHTKYVKQCGDANDARCLLGTHYNVVSWFSLFR